MTLLLAKLASFGALQNLLMTPPSSHPPSAICELAQQSKLTRAWGWASSYLMQQARPDTTVEIIMNVLTPLEEHLWCEQCRNMLGERIKAITSLWESVKV